jgi:hypothetical protein
LLEDADPRVRELAAEVQILKSRLAVQEESLSHRSAQEPDARTVRPQSSDYDAVNTPEPQLHQGEKLVLGAAVLQNGSTGNGTTEGKGDRDGEERDAGVAESQSSRISSSIEPASGTAAPGNDSAEAGSTEHKNDHEGEDNDLGPAGCESPEPDTTGEGIQDQIQDPKNNEDHSDAGPQGSKKPTKPKKKPKKKTKKKHSGKRSGKRGGGDNDSYPGDDRIDAMHDGSDDESIHKGGGDIQGVAPGDADTGADSKVGKVIIAYTCFHDALCSAPIRRWLSKLSHFRTTALSTL